MRVAPRLRRQRGWPEPDPLDRTADLSRTFPRFREGFEHLTPDRRRRAVSALQIQFGVTERRACRVVGQPRSTQRLKVPDPTDDELALRAFLRGFARPRPRWTGRVDLVVLALEAK